MLSDGDINYLIELIGDAGKKILTFYKKNVLTEIKSDNSPVTLADLSSHEVIVSGLGKFGLPVISEECKRNHDIKSDKYWLVDPLDGTKEFINNSQEFTVNIALIQENKPIFGIVSAPALDSVWYGVNDSGAYKIKSGQKKQIKCRVPAEILVSLVSKSHADKSDLEKFYHINNFSGVIEKPAGSSLKICYLAEGKADVYPRLGTTMEWDIAAAQAVLESAGGYIYSKNGGSLEYGKVDLYNPHFVASGFKHKYRFLNVDKL